MDSVSNHVYSPKNDTAHPLGQSTKATLLPQAEKLASSKQQGYIYPNIAKQKSSNEWF
jgi:hypothetical protein